MEKNEFIYFFITYFRKQKENPSEIDFIVPENKEKQPIIVYFDEQVKNPFYFYNKILKVSKTAGEGKKGNNYYFEFEINDEKYVISFDSKGNTFIYEVNLEVGKKIIDIKRGINQSKEYYKTIEYFLKALEKDRKESLIDNFYKETIKLYSNKKGFVFLIELFLKIYQKKNLCPELLSIFKDINLNPKENAKNMDKSALLKDYTSKFKEIKSEAEKLIETNNYNFVEFYGIILCYLNYYDYENFCLVVNKLYKKNSSNLYEILLIYSEHFDNAINQNFDFFDSFIKYSLKKDFQIFEKSLKYIKDIETYLNIIEKNKEKIFENYNSSKIEKIIKLDDLKFKKLFVEDESNKMQRSTQEKVNNSETSLTLSKGIISFNVDKKKFKDILEVIDNIKSIIKFCNDKNTFVIYFTNNFWQYVLNYYNEPKSDNIVICSKLRETFILYHKLVFKIFKDKDVKKFTIKRDVSIYFERDEFAIILDLIIKKYNSNPEKEMTNIDKLAFITKYNPYYKESKYSNKVDCSIFDSFDLNVDKEYVEFRRMNFELIFKDSISDYIKKFMEKIKNISNFNAVIKLINVKNIEDKNLYLKPLKQKYDNFISNEIGLLTDENLKEAIHIVAKIAIINYSYETGNKKYDFIKERIQKLDMKIIPLIYIEIINICFNKVGKEKDVKKEDEEKDNNLYESENKIIDEDDIDIDFSGMKQFIIDEFSNKLENEEHIKNIIKLIDCLEDIDKKNKENKEVNMVNEFLEKLITKNQFTKEEFFSYSTNYKILLIYNLYKKKKIEKFIKDFYENTLDSIQKDIEGNIKKYKLEEFLNNKENIVKQRLELIKLILPAFDPEDKYEQLKKRNEEINKDLNDLSKIKDNIIIYYKEYYQDIITRITEVIKTSQNQKIIEYKKGGRIGDLIKETEGLNDTAEKINNVKGFLLFNVIYDANPKKDEDVKFENSYNKLKEIGDYLNDKNKTDDVIITDLNDKYNNYFKKIKDKLCDNAAESEKFIDDFKSYYKINNNNLISELEILFKSKKYELDINSIIFFFEYKFEPDEWNKKLLPKDYVYNWEKSFQNIKDDLKKLKTNNIYDYKEFMNYNEFFRCLYEKKEAIDFLFSKNSEDILKLKDKIQPTDRTINIKDIIDTENCVSIIAKLKKIEGNSEKFEFITRLEPKTISQFENYAKIYSSVIELDTDEDFSDNIYDTVIMIISEATFNILQDNENFLYYNEKKKEYEKITMEELIHLKNQIHLKNEIGNNEDDIIKSKCKILLFFKDIISKLEIINAYMNILRKKGSSLPIKICVKICIKNKEPNIEYHLDKYKKEFEEIREFLFDAKNAYITQLESIYKEKLNLRFLHGKQFRSIMKHIKQNYKIDSFLRYILNNTDNTAIINEGEKCITYNVQDYINNKQYIIYSRNSLDIISSYITSLFSKNFKSLESHYEKMKITKNGFRGIYLYECGNKSKEEFIINLFWEKVKELPIAQNVLITNNETTSEEIQAFFHRAVLCKYNTLFVIEINDSFSEFQQSIMNNYIDILLSYKNNEYNKETKENIDKKSTEIYLDSCIVFIYDNKNKNIIPFVKEIEKFINKEEEPENTGKPSLSRLSTARKLTVITDKNKEQCRFNNTYLKNIVVITSDICGLGKSKEIKKKIDNENKFYFHFPLGGILTKSIIFDKLDKLLNDVMSYIKNNNKSYKDIAIHLDLTESKETSIINEFLFSFLITRFYTNNENIIYVPKDIRIYIEIPNCFKDYLSKFSILTIFNKENINFDNMPLFDFSDNIIKHFENMLDIKTKNQGIQEFVKKYIGGGDTNSRYSYHQINIFVKLFISQYSKFKTKLKFVDEKDADVTEKCIEEFAKCTQYFTNGGFAKLLTERKLAKKNVISILSKVYENDLRNMKFPAPLIFIFKKNNKNYFDKLKIPEKESKRYKSSKDYLQRFIEILNLPYTVEFLLSIIEEKNNNYVITNDNFKKMVLLVYRIIANVPVIIMGDTGCGKTSLIIKLNQIINGGKTCFERKNIIQGEDKEVKTLKIINIHPGITDEWLCKEMEKAGRDAEELNYYGKELWLFFDEMNTCLSLSLLTQIFINRKYEGKKIHDNIRLIGACNPYRKRKKDKEKCGLSMTNDNDNELVYLVQPFPQSLLYYVFSFGSISEDDEKKYIYSILESSFSEDKEEEKILHDITTDAISKSHIFLRERYDPSVVSLREIARFTKCIEFFKQYFRIKNTHLDNRRNNEKNNMLRSIICSIYLCYYIRLTDQKIRTLFESELRPIFLKLINYDKNKEDNGSGLLEQIDNEELKLEIDTRSPDEIINNFTDFLKIEQDFLIEQIELDKGIGKNTLLKENTFLLFLSLVTNIPLIIIGKPGTGKSLSAQLIYKSMKGKYSKNKFFQKFPRLIQIYFQGSQSTMPEDLIRLFRKAESKSLSFIRKFQEKKIEERDLPIIMVLFDELGLAERSESNPLKVLHEKLEYTGKKDGVSFVGISNYSLDAAKINRALVLSVPDLDERLDDLTETSKNIVESISEKIKDDQIFKLISYTYFQYKKIIKDIKDLVVYKQYVIEKSNSKDKQTKEEISEKSEEDISESMDSDSRGSSTIMGDQNQKSNETNTQSKPKEREKRQFDAIKQEEDFKYLMKKEKKIRIDFHGNRDFYNIIRGIAIDLKSGDITDQDKVAIIIRYIERNFGGIDYEIDIDLKSTLEDTKEVIELLERILSDYDYEENKEIIKLSSVFLFKKLYNIECEKEDPKNTLKIDKLKLNDYNLNKCINDNIKDNNSRYLLLEIMPSLTPLICQNIKLQNPYKTEIQVYDGSPFIDDNDKEYRFNIINKIQEDAKEDKLIIIENLNQIHPFLFELYNMNYIIKNGKKIVRICLENFNEQQTVISEKFRIIILVDKRFVSKCNLAFLNRLEKMILSFDKLLDNDLKRISSQLIDEIKLKRSIEKYKKINYSLKDLLFNCRDEEIQALIYYFSKELKKNDNEESDEQKENKIDEEKLKDIVVKKLYKILPQDIICILHDKNIIRKYYKENDIFYNFKDYINDEKNKDYKISIIYTFTGISNNVIGLNKKMSFMVSEIRSENGLKRKIDEIKNQNEKSKLKKEYNICIDFEQSNSKKIKFISNFILNNENYKKDNYHYIFIIHINRNFNNESDDNVSIGVNKNQPKNHNKKNEKIYSLPDINKSINQIFIDNLDGNNIIKLKDFLSEDIKKLLDEKKVELKLGEEFNKILVNTLTKELNNKGMEEEIINEYISELQQYLEEEVDIRDKIIQIAYNLIENNKNKETNCKDIIDKLYKSSFINKYTVDIASCLIEYIKDNIFSAYVKKVLQKLEDNNVLTTLYWLHKTKFQKIDKSSVNHITLKYLDEIIKDETEAKPEYKFLFNYNVPGLYNFYKNFSNYLNKNITSNYFNNEKKLRDALNVDKEFIRQFNETNDQLLINANKYFINNNFITVVLNQIEHDLIFNDYVTYYLEQKMNNGEIYKIDDVYHKLLNLLLKLRFKNNENENDKNINSLLLKIIWIESNGNYILNILRILEHVINILDSDKLINKIEELIYKSEKKINYITNKDRNPEHTREVNECYYILLASICYSITAKEINLTLSTGDKINNKIEVFQYHYNITEINKILQNLDDDLYLFLNEMYILDELIKIIELFTKNGGVNIDKINEIKDLLRENCLIIQEYSVGEEDGNRIKLNYELKNNFELIYNSIIKDEIIDKNDKDYYDKLRYIFFKEIRKISDVDYRYLILEKLLESNEMIKKSKDIFQILLKNYVKRDFTKNRNEILSGKDDIIKLLDKTVNKNFVLAETLLYFFEKNSFDYLEYIVNSKKEITNEKKKKETIIIKLDDEPLSILKECYDILYLYTFDPKKLDKKLVEICKLYCLGYIKSFIHTFIKALEDKDEKNKFNNVNHIINLINGSDSIYKMIRIYIYKKLFYDVGVDVFINPKMIKKYHLDDYKDFNEFIQTKEIYNICKIEYTIRTIKDDNFKDANLAIEKYKKGEFKEKIDVDDYDLENFGIDNFYVISYNLILLNLLMENPDLELIQNFYRNICEPLFGEDELLLKGIQLFYDPEKYKKIKESFKFNSNNIKSILFGYRYCLNELSTKKKKGIYYPIYDEDYQKHLSEHFFPGNDSKTHDIYSKIMEHFDTKPNEGCYVCLCKNGFYHSVKSGFPGDKELNKHCPKCSKNIGTEKKGILFSEKLIVKRSDYVRIFKDKKEIDELKKNVDFKNKLKEINYMTLDDYKKKYVINDKEIQIKGIYANSNKNQFKNDKKIVRNLNQLSFRILNYILYSHLFFARLITNKKNDFDKYLPKNMGWAETLNECWNILKNELLKENIDSIEKFMSYIFSDLFLILNQEKKIDSFESLLTIENMLNKKIKELIKKYKDYETNNQTHQENDRDKNSFISLLKETYIYRDYSQKEFPFYQYFYYTNYLDIKFINEKLSHLDPNNYPVLIKYLESKNESNDNNNYSLSNLNLFNTALNLINENYYNKISREYSEKNKLKDEKIYNENKVLIDKFIILINDLSNDNSQKLNIENPLNDFLLDDNNKFGLIYKQIYRKYAEEQNKRLEYLLDNKINSGIFDIICKNSINIQQIKEKEIFTLILPKEISFIDILFNSSYRKILDSDIRSNDSYKEYEINYDLIEECLTELLLRNKKLLKDEVTQFIYNDEVFANQVTDLISIFRKSYNCQNINIYDKIAIYRFYKDNQDNSFICKTIINDFMELFKYRKDKNEKKKENSGENCFVINEETKIYKVIENNKDNFSVNFIRIFDKNDSLTMDKTSEVFFYYLKLIFDLVKGELNKYKNDLNYETTKKIEEYFNKDRPISKKNFAGAIRLFSTLVLFMEEDKNKEKKLGMNRNNIVNYLRASDLWDNAIYDSEDFNKNLNELKLFNVQINQILPLYDFLGKDIEDNFCDDVNTQIENEESKDRNPEDIRNDDDDDDDDDPFAAKDNDDENVGDRH